MGKLKCPECGGKLVLCVDVVHTYTKKIKNDGSLYKEASCSKDEETTGAPYLECENNKCDYSYDTEHASGDISVPEFDDWIWEHSDEIAAFRG